MIFLRIAQIEHNPLFLKFTKKEIAYYFEAYSRAFKIWSFQKPT